MVRDCRYRGKADEERLSSDSRKKVTFDSNVKTYEPVFSEVTSNLPEISEVREVKKKKEEEDFLVRSKQSQSFSEASSITSSSGSYPSNYRYQNCRDSEDEDDELDLGSDLDDDEEGEEDDGVVDYDDICEDDGSDYAESRIAVGKADAKEVVDSSLVTSDLDERCMKLIRGNRRVRDRSVHVKSVLNPVENLTQWKAVLAKGKPQLKQPKENFAVDQEPRPPFSLEPSFKEFSQL
ncbi:uncharacterized protein LOC123223432 [Mangifera indica]|uniref:uncharacterized protein LOC123223432 n=1 Tax=Mangifera indica TaxID=29780 RepID=UPI001CFAB0E2|nr:uncharacterized protein LOC123223432 [Mangifera indica]